MFQLIFYKIFPAENSFLFSHDGTPSLLQITKFSSRKSFMTFLIEHFKTASKMYFIKKYLIPTLVLIVVMTACNKDNIVCSDVKQTNVRLSLNIEYEIASTKGGIVEPASVDNLWVLQYNGTDDNAVLVGTPTYISNFNSGVSSVKLVVSATNDNTVVFLANTSNPSLIFSPASSLSELKAGKSASVSNPDDMAMFASGCYVGKLSTDMTEITANIKRNYARVVFTLSNTSALNDEPVTIKSVQLKSVPSSTSYYAAFVTSESGVMFPASTGLATYDYPLIEWNDDTESEYYVDSDTRKYTFLMPVNARGTSSSSTYLEKSKYAPDAATYMEIDATYQREGHGVPVVFRVYIGGNDINDYNILPNAVYDVSYTIKTHGDDAVDSRVNDFTGVDFSVRERANCYIINPPKSGKQEYRIPVDRVNTFWGSNGYENDPAYTLLQTTDWNVSVIWSDFIVNSDESSDVFNFRISKGTGTGFEDNFIVTVASGTVGNVLVGIKRNDNDTDYLWSWHLWITDYTPDESIGMAPVENQFSYKVTGGRVHRYKGALWESGGIYERKFIMDRNIGAPSVDFYGLGAGNIQYVYGRKDPIPGNVKYDANGNKWTQQKIDLLFYSKSYNALQMSVHNPSMMYRGKYATGNSDICGFGYYSKYQPEQFDKSIIWYDPLTKDTQNNAAGKSLFDPCPAGWRIPKPRTWDDFRDNNGTNTSVTVNISATGFHQVRGFSDPEAVHGICYWPYVQNDEGTYDVTEYVFYPLCGWRQSAYSPTGLKEGNFHGGDFYDNIILSQTDRLRDNQLQAGTVGYNYKFDQLRVDCSSAAYGFNMSNTYVVRCVQE